MIPKVIHYCWFGGKELPADARRYIETWRKNLPGYEIRRWDESNYDVGKIAFTADAYADKRYAFVSDYARFDILYHHGGVYFDTDVELIRPMEEIIAAGAFMGCEYNPAGKDDPHAIRVNPGVGMACEAGDPLIGEILEKYRNIKYENPDGAADPDTIVTHTTKLMRDHGLKNAGGRQRVGNFWVYPQEYFNPISIYDGKTRIEESTYTIHHFAQSWQKPSRRLIRRIVMKLGGPRLKNAIKKLLLK
ncbi:MAG: glycosyl transferase [Muribaculum sp.]|nr:glycosyl transferase [Muribaculum sp.]